MADIFPFLPHRPSADGDVPAYDPAAELMAPLRRSLECQFGTTASERMFVHVVLLTAVDLLGRLKDEDDLDTFLNGCFEERSSPWRLVRS